MGNIIEELVLIHNENFKNKVENKYFSEMILNEQYEMYCLFNYGEKNFETEKLEMKKKFEKNSENNKNFGADKHNVFKAQALGSLSENGENNKNQNQNEKKVLGYAVFYGTIESIDIFEIAIKKQYQGHGFGKKLLMESMKNLFEINKDNGHFENKFLLEVNENNIKALKLYEKAGFEKISVRKNYYGNGENAVIMIKCI